MEAREKGPQIPELPVFKQLENSLCQISAGIVMTFALGEGSGSRVPRPLEQTIQGFHGIGNSRLQLTLTLDSESFTTRKMAFQTQQPALVSMNLSTKGSSPAYRSQTSQTCPSPPAFSLPLVSWAMVGGQGLKCLLTQGVFSGMAGSWCWPGSY